MRRIWISLVVVLLMVTASVCLAQAREQTADKAKPTVTLTEEEKAALNQARDVQKALRIARLELALMEAKEAPQKDIAAKAETVYRLQGELHALRVKNPALAQVQWREREREGRGRGMGRGQGRGFYDGKGLRGAGGRHGFGRGGSDLDMMGPGMGKGRGAGRGMGMGRGQGQGQGMGRRGMGGRGGDGRGMGQMMRMREQAFEERFVPMPPPIEEQTSEAPPIN